MTRRTGPVHVPGAEAVTGVAVLRSGDDDFEFEFEFGPRRMLDGIETCVSAARDRPVPPAEDVGRSPADSVT